MTALRSNRRKKIVKLHSTSMLNIGTMMFGIVFLYILIYLVMYLTADHITAYEVTEGPLSGNYQYTAIALKSEFLVTCSESGPINYYAREGSKVGVGNGIYAIGNMNLASSTSGEELADLDNENYSNLRSICSSFSTNFKTSSYQDVYNFKADAQTAMIELLSKKVLDSTEQGISAGLNLIPTDKDGIVVYSIDGMEGYTVDDITMDDFNKKNYSRENLRMKESVKAGDVVYKLLTSENWSMIIPLDKKTAMSLADQSVVRFRFMKDGSTFNADFSIYQTEGNYLGKLDISNSLIRFASDRFIDIELLINRQNGLKIPNSAISEKVFYRIPREYVTVNEQNENEITLRKETYDTDGSAVTKVITATVYDKTDMDYFVDTSLFEAGDYVLMKDSSKRYQISDTKTLTGVYNINKGYPVFREITIIDENEEYCIVESDSAYGLAQFDQIALDASAVKEDAFEE
ncbi:MAG: HlyD family efflux transporter periplasmic adaptor subunit [Eubacteriales bacterium]|nr:HlyD family efflux transporter periplasmic adaptor subunit [Eubacteriales bacterium]